MAMVAEGLDSSLKIVGIALKDLSRRLDHTGKGARRIFWRGIVAAAESTRRTAERTSSAFVASLETLERQARTRSRRVVASHHASTPPPSSVRTATARRAA
jgi:hypothetical protein